MKFVNPSITWDSFSKSSHYQAQYGFCPPDLLALIGAEDIRDEVKTVFFLTCDLVPEKAKLFFVIRCMKEIRLEDGRLLTVLIHDTRSIKAIEIAQEYALGNATEKELDETIRPACDAANAFWRAHHATAAAHLADAAWAISGKRHINALSDIDSALMLHSKRSAFPEFVEIAKSMIEQ